jgi:hypothetical protein
MLLHLFRVHVHVHTVLTLLLVPKFRKRAGDAPPAWYSGRRSEK